MVTLSFDDCGIVSREKTNRGPSKHILKCGVKYSEITIVSRNNSVSDDVRIYQINTLLGCMETKESVVGL